MYTSSLIKKYALAQVEHQAVAFTAEEEAAWREAQEEAERVKQEARRQRELAERAAEDEKSERMRKIRQLVDDAEAELERSQRK